MSYISLPGICLRVLVGRLLMYESRVGVDVLECATGKVNRSKSTEIDTTIWGE